MKKLFLLLGVVALVLLPLAAMADLYSGSLTTADGSVIGNNRYSSANGGFYIQWLVTPITGGYNYHYEFYREDGTTKITDSDVSHIIFQVSESTTKDDFFNADPPYSDDSPRYWDGTLPSNPDMPFKIWGLKFNDPGTQAGHFYYVDFDSTRAPTWGSFYAKGGQNDTAWNNYLDEKYISVPDTQVVPLPGALLLLGGGLVRLLVRRQS